MTDSTPPEAASAVAALNNDMDEARHAAYERAEHEAQVLDEFFPSVVSDVLCQMALGKHVSANGYKLFHDNLAADCDLTHPLAKMLADQMVWAHFAVGNLHLRAAAAATEEVRIAMTATAGRLMVEYRKSLTALREYWEPQGPDNTAAESAEEQAQQVGVDQSHAATTAEKNAADIEQGSNGAHTHGAAANGTFSAANRRQSQPCNGEGSIVRRPAKVG